MTPDARATLLERIDNHHAAMRAQVEKPDVPLEFLTSSGRWVSGPRDATALVSDDGVTGKRWHRLAPAPTPAALDPGEGWTLLKEGTPLQKGDGVRHPEYSGYWVDFDCRPDLFRGDKQYAHTWPWRRKAKLVDLDQGDFLGPSRITHLRNKHCNSAPLVLYVDEHGVYLHNQIWVAYNAMRERECSRDGGATFGPCSKPALTVAEAQQRHVCRVCGKPAVTASVDNALVLDYGKEFAHEQCLKREKASV